LGPLRNVHDQGYGRSLASCSDNLAAAADSNHALSGKNLTRFQLNIENLTDNDKPIWGRNGAGDTGYITLPGNFLQNGNPRM